MHSSLLGSHLEAEILPLLDRDCCCLHCFVLHHHSCSCACSSSCGLDFVTLWHQNMAPVHEPTCDACYPGTSMSRRRRPASPFSSELADSFLPEEWPAAWRCRHVQVMEDMQGLLQQEHCQLYLITYLMWAHVFTPVQGAFLSVKMFPVHPSVRTRSSRGWK